MSFDIMTGKTSVKAALRGEMRERLSAMSASERNRESGLIREQLIFPDGAKVALFAGMKTEPALLDLIEKTLEIEWFLPRVIGRDSMDFLPSPDPKTLVKGTFGIPEPCDGAPATDLDFIICPGLAFTRQGHRLGQGGGFYDRALSRFPTARWIGAAFSCQLLETLPVEPHDVAMKEVITPSQGS